MWRTLSLVPQAADPSVVKVRIIRHGANAGSRGCKGFVVQLASIARAMAAASTRRLIHVTRAPSSIRGINAPRRGCKGTAAQPASIAKATAAVK